MRSLFISAAVVTAALALCGCPYHKQQQPVPGPQSPATSAKAAGAALHREVQHGPSSAHAVSEISWFQGTLEEAFARRPCPADHPQFRS
jgi:hypothetical protein